ncbi:MAG: hypothetical protein ACYCPQ_09770 [Elusimicrobiota bacterium]
MNHKYRAISLAALLSAAIAYPAFAVEAEDGAPEQINLDLPRISDLSMPLIAPIGALNSNLPASLPSDPDQAAKEIANQSKPTRAAKMISAMAKMLKGSIATAADPKSSASDSAQAGRRMNDALTGESSVFIAGSGAGSHSGSIPWMPAHPAEFYHQALAEARHTAGRYGVKPQDVNLGEIKGTFSPRDRHEISYEFYIKPGNGPQNSGIIYVDFSRDWALPKQRMGLRTATFITNPISKDVAPGRMEPAAFAKKVIYSPQAALDAARKKLPALGLNASYSLKQDIRDNGEDFWYHIYDTKGHAAAVNARTGKILDIGRK